MLFVEKVQTRVIKHYERGFKVI